MSRFHRATVLRKGAAATRLPAWRSASASHLRQLGSSIWQRTGMAARAGAAAIDGAATLASPPGEGAIRTWSVAWAVRFFRLNWHKSMWYLVTAILKPRVVWAADVLQV